MLSIPREILDEIFQYTGRLESILLGLTCKQLSAVVVHKKISLSDMYEITANNGCIGILEWLKEYTGRVLPIDGKKAARAGHLEVIKWFRQNLYISRPSRVFDGAASGGHLDIIIWMSGLRGQPIGRGIILKAAKYGHIHVIIWADDCYGENLLRHNASYYAAINGRVETFIWLDTHGYTWSYLGMHFILQYAPLGIIKYLHKMNHPQIQSVNLMTESLRRGRLGIAKWIYKKGGVIYREAYADAANMSYDDILKWLIEIKHPIWKK